MAAKWPWQSPRPSTLISKQLHGRFVNVDCDVESNEANTPESNWDYQHIVFVVFLFLFSER